MRTEADLDGVASLSRRAFVVAAGSAVAASTAGTAAGADEEAVTVEATTPYLPAARDAADAFGQGESDARVEVSRADGGPGQRVGDGPVDVHVSGRPPTAGGEDDASGLARGVAVHGWATLATRGDDWRECLRGSSLRERIADHSAVEAWSETDWESVETLRADGPTGQCVGRTATDDDRTHLVRGTRAYQYARGHGGVSYYEVPAATVGAPSATRRQGDGVVPLVRLAYVHVDPESLDGAAVGEFLRYYSRRSPAIDELSIHAGADVGDGARFATA